jgi:hypothetical protein
MKKFWSAVLVLVILAAIAVVFFPEQVASLRYGLNRSQPVTMEQAKTVETELVYEGKKPEGVGSVQSFAIAGDYFVIAGRPSGSAENGGETNNQLVIIRRSTKEDLTARYFPNGKTFELGHANGMAYNPKTNEIIVVGIRNEAGKYELATRISLSDFSVKGTDRMPCYGTGIAYDDARGTYYVRSGGTIYTLNGIPGMVKKTVTAETSFTSQDMGFYDGYTYLVNWVNDASDATAQKYKLEQNSNVIYKVDARGNIVGIFVVKNPQQELEGIDFVNGEVYLLYNGVGNDKGKFFIYRLKISAEDLK